MSKSATRVGCRVQQIVNIHEGRDVFHARNFAFVTKGSGGKGGRGIGQEDGGGDGRKQGDHRVKSRYAS